MSKTSRNYTITKAAKERDGYHCQVCGTTLALRVHHIIPLVVGGLDILSNTITYCLWCHNIEHGPSGSAPLFILSQIGRGILPSTAILLTASWLGMSGCSWAGYQQPIVVSGSRLGI